MSDGQPRRALRCLFITADRHPCTRVDVADLFAHRLAERGHAFDWLMQSSTPSAAFQEPWGGGTLWVGAAPDVTTATGKLRRLWLGLRHDLMLYRLAARQRYDLIIVKDKFLVVLLACLVKRRFGTPFAFWLSFPFPESAAYKAAGRRWPLSLLERLRARFLHWVLYRLVPRHARHVFAQSRWMADALIRQGFPPEQVTPVPMGVSMEKVAEHCQQPVPAPPRRAIYIGVLNRARRLDFLLRAFQRTLGQVPDAELYIVGDAHDAADVEQLRQLSRDLKIDHAVHFTGQLPGDEVWRLVRQSLIGVSPIPPTPEFWPSSPTKLVEYLALERAVVANDLPDQALVIEASGGGRCVPWDEAAFADAMAELLGDPEQALALGRRGRPWVGQHRAYAIIADEVEETLLRLAP